MKYLFFLFSISIAQAAEIDPKACFSELKTFSGLTSSNTLKFHDWVVSDDWMDDQVRIPCQVKIGFRLKNSTQKNEIFDISFSDNNNYTYTRSLTSDQIVSCGILKDKTNTFKSLYIRIENKVHQDEGQTFMLGTGPNGINSSALVVIKSTTDIQGYVCNASSLKKRIEFDLDQ